MSSSTTRGIYGIWCKSAKTWLQEENEDASYNLVSLAISEIDNNLVNKDQYEVRRFDELPIAEAAPLQTGLFGGVAS